VALPIGWQGVAGDDDDDENRRTVRPKGPSISAKNIGV
jgi:hypothetical protein